MGTGKRERNFDENSIIGKQMLGSPEIINGIKELLAIYKSFGQSENKIERVLVDENELVYPLTFLNDLEHNPARALHGSFSGSLSIESIQKTPLGLIYTINVSIKDNLSATSGTRLLPIFGRYSEGNAIFSGPNPFGIYGNFRTISTNYNMTIKMFKYN